MGTHRVLFEDDPEIGRKVWLIFNEWGRIVGAHVEQEVDDIVDRNHQEAISTMGNRFGD